MGGAAHGIPGDPDPGREGAIGCRHAWWRGQQPPTGVVGAVGAVSRSAAVGGRFRPIVVGRPGHGGCVVAGRACLPTGDSGFRAAGGCGAGKAIVACTGHAVPVDNETQLGHTFAYNEREAQEPPAVVVARMRDAGGNAERAARCSCVIWRTGRRTWEDAEGWASGQRPRATSPHAPARPRLSNLPRCCA